MRLLVFLIIIGRMFWQHLPAVKAAHAVSAKQLSLKECPFNKEQLGIYEEKEDVG